MLTGRRAEVSPSRGGGGFDPPVIQAEDGGHLHAKVAQSFGFGRMELWVLVWEFENLCAEKARAVSIA